MGKSVAAFIGYRSRQTADMEGTGSPFIAFSISIEGPVGMAPGG